MKNWRPSVAALAVAKIEPHQYNDFIDLCESIENEDELRRMLSVEEFEIYEQSVEHTDEKLRAECDRLVECGKLPEL